MFLCLDNNCRSMLFTLIQLSSMYADEQGWFFRSTADLEAETGLSKKVMDGTLDAMLKKNLVDFIPQQQGKGVKQTSRKYRVNFHAFLNFEKCFIEDCIKNPDYKIVTSDYKNGAFSWQGKEWAGKRASLSLSGTTTSIPTSTKVSPQPQPKVPTSIDTKENKEIINKRENNLLNINYLSNSKTTVEGNGAEHGHRSSTLHDGCLQYVLSMTTPNVMDMSEGMERSIAHNLVNLLGMDCGSLPKDDNVFFNTVDNYVALYGVNDRKQAIKDINTLKRRALEIISNADLDNL